jgi:hypothetical protein
MEKEKFISAKLSKYVKLWKQGIEQSDFYVMKMSGLLGGYFITFVKTFACSKVYSCGGLLAF